MLVRWSNWLEFDDEKKTILKAFRQRIPYDKVQVIFINEAWSGFTVNIKTGKLQVYPLVSGLNKGEATLVEKEFTRRFPPDIIRKESHRRRLTIVAAIALLILVIAFANFFYRSSRLETVESITAEKRDWLTSDKATEGRQYQINGVNFLLPVRFSQSKTENTWLFFEDTLNKTKVKVGPGLLQDTGFKRNSIFAYVTGIQDDHDFFRLGYTARFGLIPTMNNSTTFRNLLDVKLYEFERNDLKGIVLQGMRGSKSVAEIIVANRKRGIQFFVSQPGEIGRIKEELLQSIVASIQAAD